MDHRRKAGISALLAAALCTLAGCERGYHLVYGLIDDQGHWTVQPRFDALEPPVAGLAAARQGGRWGFVGPAGEWAIEPRYTRVRPFSEGRAAVLQDDEWRFIDRSGEVVIPGPFKDVQSFDGGMAAVRLESGWGFVDHSGRFVIAPRFEELGSYREDIREDAPRVRCFSEGLCAVKAAAGWGYIDRSGQMVIEPAFAEADWFREGLAAVHVQSDSGSGAAGFIDRRGRWAIEPRFRQALWFCGGRAIAVLMSSGETAPPAVLIDTTGHELAVVGWEPFNGLDDEVREFLRIVAPDYLAAGLVPATRAGRWGFMDRQGGWVIEPRFDQVLPFRNGVAAVASHKDRDDENLLDFTDWGLMDPSGRWIREPAPHLPGRYGDPYLMAVQHGLQGLLDRDGHWRVSPRFGHPEQWIELPGAIHGGYHEGQLVAAVYANHDWVITDRRGRVQQTARFEWLDELGPDAVTVLHRGRWGIADPRLRPLLPEQLDATPRQSGEFIEAVRESRTGCLDRRGRWLVPAEFSEILECRDGPIAAATDAGWGIWRAGSGWLLPPRYAAVSPLWSDFWEVESAEGWQFFRIGPAGTDAALLPGGPYAAIDYATRDVRMARRGDRYAPISRTGPAPREFPYEKFDARPMNAPQDRAQWVIAVQADARWGLLDQSGRLRLSARYDEIGTAWDGLIAVAVAGAWGIVDLDGHEVFAATLAGALPVSRDVVAFREGSLWGLMDRAGRVLVAPRFASISHKEQWLVASLPEPGGSGLLDLRGRVLAEPRYQSIEQYSADLWLARDHEGWLLLDKRSGQPTRRLPRVDKVEAVAEKRAAVQVSPIDGGAALWGYLDPQGRSVIPPQFEQASAFRDGVAVVERGGQCGAIDRDGRIIVPIRYDHCNALGGGRIAAGTEAPVDPTKPEGS